jgi:transposase
LPPGVPAGAFGPRLRAILSVLAGGYRMGKRPIQQLTFDLLGLTISTGAIRGLERRAADVLEAPVAELRNHVRDAGSAHVDETSWRQARRKAWLWGVVTRLATVFTIADSRGADVAKDLLGTDRKKVVVSDRFKGYGWIKRRQFCWAHLNRDFQAMADRKGEAAEVGRLLLGHSERLFDWWRRVQDGTMARSTFRSKVDAMRFSFRDDLRRGLASGCAKTAGTSPGTAGRRAPPVDVRASRGDRADQQRRRAGAAARVDLPQTQRRDRRRGRKPIRRADALGGGDLPPTKRQRVGLPDPLLPGRPRRPPHPFAPPRHLRRSSRLKHQTGP